MTSLLLPGLAAACLAAAPLAAQQPANPTVDSVAVTGNARVPAARIVSTAGLVIHQQVSYRDIQRAVDNLFRTGEFDDVAVDQETRGGKLILVFKVRERPLLDRWTLTGVEKLSPGDVREKIRLAPGRPIDRQAVARARSAIDSLYQRDGFYAAAVSARELPDPKGGVTVAFDVAEGSRIALSRVVIEGNHAFPDAEIVRHMASRPEGFWWFRNGEYDRSRVDEDMRERLPEWYGAHGHIDFQAVGDTLLPDSSTGKGVLQVTVEEGPTYRVGKFEVNGNRRFSSEDLSVLYPFTGPGQVFNASAWQAATSQVENLYSNNGYIYAQVQPVTTRRTLPDSTRVIDLGWNIVEGQVATINKINIVGNDVTHERVIREAIVLLPGQVFSRDALIRSYQNVSNLGFFQQPLPMPDVKPSSNGVDVDVTFRVEEKRTGNINFGASLGQGTGIGGFIGLQEPNLFGRGKKGQFQWQFGANINDFTLSYTDPAIRESRISGTVQVYDSRQKFILRDLGRRQQTGASLQIGFPFFGARYTRLFASYGLQRIRYSEGSTDIQQRFVCNNCTRSTVGLGLLRDTRVGLPFPTGGTQVSVNGELNGGLLGGTGNYQKLEFEGHWYAPLGSLGGKGQIGSGIQFVLGLTAKSGFIFGDAANFFTELYSLGGVQFGIPLRGYDEFSITPNGYDPLASSGSVSPDAFGKAYSAFTVEAGARLSQALYVDAFMDAGNVYRTARQWDPTRLFRGAGFGVALVSPLGPIGLDLAYGFDKVDVTGKPAPGWKVHIKVGNLF